MCLGLLAWLAVAVCHPEITEKPLGGCRFQELKNVCPQNVELRWMTEVSSSVYATPLITDLYSDGHKDIIVPSFVHYLEVTSPDAAAADAHNAVSMTEEQRAACLESSSSVNMGSS